MLTYRTQFGVALIVAGGMMQSALAGDPCIPNSVRSRFKSFFSKSAAEPAAPSTAEPASRPATHDANHGATSGAAKKESHKLAMAHTPFASAEKLVIDDEVKAAGMMPKGGAVMTSAGMLEGQGIRHIIHAASGSMTRSGPKFEPSLDGVVNSVHNSLELARRAGHHRVAVPFIGGKIFIDRIGIQAQELANQIVDAALKSRGNLELRFVTFGAEDTALFQTALKRHASEVTPQMAQVTSGSITDFSVHGASAIINAANMEVRFGGGLSGAIGRATGRANQIDEEAQKAIRDFYHANP
jgi:O-acetyl-ADP-ribose deacetylase (regulator of RNase III)